MCLFLRSVLLCSFLLIPNITDGQVIAVMTEGDNVTISQIVVDRSGEIEVLSATDLIGFEMTEFSGESSEVLLLGNGESVPMQGERSELFDGDFRVDTGLRNLEQSATAVSVVFEAPIVNGPGVDIFLFEFDDLGMDGVRIHLNGLTVQNILPNPSNPLLANVTSDNYRSEFGRVESLDELENDSFEYVETRSFEIYGYSIDLSEFEVPLGEAITSFTFGAEEGGVVGGIDPVFMAGLPTKILLGDINCDGLVDLLDVMPFVDFLSAGTYSPKADINSDGSVDLLDVAPFIELLTGG